MGKPNPYEQMDELGGFSHNFLGWHPYEYTQNRGSNSLYCRWIKSS